MLLPNCFPKLRKTEPGKFQYLAMKPRIYPCCRPCLHWGILLRPISMCGGLLLSRCRCRSPQLLKDNLMKRLDIQQLILPVVVMPGTARGSESFLAPESCHAHSPSAKAWRRSSQVCRTCRRSKIPVQPFRLMADWIRGLIRPNALAAVANLFSSELKRPRYPRRT